MSTQDDGKRRAAQAAVDLVPEDAVIGVGTGSTVNHFIELLSQRGGRVAGAVASSKATEQRLRAARLDVVDLNAAGTLALYVDGADEADPHRRLIKGGGGALTREKIVAAASRQFVCIVDESKLVDVLGAFALPVEVIPMARSYVARELVRLGGHPVYREGVVTDNGNVILDVHGLDLTAPVEMEQRLNNLAGVVCNGLFAARPADVLLVGGAGGRGVRRIGA